MNTLVILYVLVHIVLAITVGWLLTLQGQPRAWRIVLGLIQFGALWNLAGLIWLGYSNVWPGEPVITGGFCLAFLGLVFYRQPLVTRKADS